MLTYKTHSVEPTELPEASIHALLSRGFTRLLGNEVSSKVMAKFGNEPDATDADKNEFAEACRVQLVEALKSGTIGIRAPSSRGPAIDPIIREMSKLAKDQVMEVLKSHGLKLQSTEKTETQPAVRFVTFANGATKTLEAMVATRLEVHGDAIRKTADKAIADRKRLAAKLAEAAPQAVEGEAPVLSPDALGL